MQLVLQPSPQVELSEAASLVVEATLQVAGPSQLAVLPSLPVELSTQPVSAPTPPVV